MHETDLFCQYWSAYRVGDVFGNDAGFGEHIERIRLPNTRPALAVGATFQASDKVGSVTVHVVVLLGHVREHSRLATTGYPKESGA